MTPNLQSNATSFTPAAIRTEKHASKTALDDNEILSFLSLACLIFTGKAHTLQDLLQ